MIVDLFIPCYIDQFFPDTALNMIKVLEKVGCAVNYNPEQTCCGQAGYNLGYWDEAKEIGDKFIREFQNDRYIVSPSTACSGFVKNQFNEMFHNSVLHNEYKQIQKNMFEFSDFLVNVLKITNIGATLNGTATFLDACTAKRNYHLKNEPRTLLEKVRGLKLVEMSDVDACCGFGGGFSVKLEPLSVSMAEQKIEDAENTQADFLISTDSSCLMQLESLIKKNQKPIKVMHLADVLASGWD